MRRLLIGFGAGAALAVMAGCASAPEPKVQTVVVEKKVTEPCLVPPAKPVYQFGQGAKPSGAEQARILASDFEKAEQYGVEWEVASIGCQISGGTSPVAAQPASGMPHTP